MVLIIREPLQFTFLQSFIGHICKAVDNTHFTYQPTPKNTSFKIYRWPGHLQISGDY